MSIFHRDNLNEINLKSLPGVDFNRAGVVAYVWLAIEVAFLIFVMVYGIQPNLSVFSEGSILLYINKVILIFSFVLCQIIGLNFDVRKQGLASAIFCFFAIITLSYFAFLAYIMALNILARDFYYGPAMQFLDVLRQSIQMIENEIQNFMEV
ncbi:MAG: hypothetical protein ACK41P_01160 [Asticcacaulis sp.]